MGGETAILVENLSKSFGRRQKVKALQGVSLEIQRGEVFGLIGPNGAGKTTLLSCILGFLFPDRGEVRIEGQKPEALPVRAQCGYLPERVGYFPELTGWQFLLLHAGLLGLSKDEAKKRAEERASQLGLGPGLLQRKLATYSRGLRQRIGMAQALLGNPRYLFLDEPTSGMDPEGILAVRQAILQAKKEGATVLLNSHQLAEVEKVCDRVAFLRAGHLESLRVLRRPGWQSYLLRTTDPYQEQASFLLQAAGWEVRPLEGGHLEVTLPQARLAELAPLLVGAGVPLLELRPAFDLERLFLEN
jgi:ABC-2 type transport system ATP-binding protein